MTHRGTRSSSPLAPTLAVAWLFAGLLLASAPAQADDTVPGGKLSHGKPTRVTLDAAPKSGGLDGEKRAPKGKISKASMPDPDGDVMAPGDDPEDGDTEASETETDPNAPAPDAPVAAEGEGIIKLDGSPAVVAAKPLDDTASTKKKRSPFKIATSVSSSVGQGSFVANQYARNAYVDWSLDISPSYSFWEGGPRVSASASVYQELTNTDGDTRNRRVLMSDVSLGASHKVWTIPGVDVGVTLGLRASLPTSLASQTQSLILGLRGNLGLSRSFGPLTVSYSGGMRKNFHEYQSPVYNTKGLNENSFIAREGGNERVEAFLYSAGGNNISYSFSNRLGLDLDIIEGLSGSISYSVSSGFTYASYATDDLSSDYATAGRGQRDSFQTDISLGYDFKVLQVSLGLANGAGIYASNNSSLRFPFWDFQGAANNLSTVYLSLSTSASIDGSGVSFK